MILKLIAAYVLLAHASEDPCSYSDSLYSTGLSKVYSVERSTVPKFRPLPGVLELIIDKKLYAATCAVPNEASGQAPKPGDKISCKKWCLAEVNNDISPKSYGSKIYSNYPDNINNACTPCKLESSKETLCIARSGQTKKYDKPHRLKSNYDPDSVLQVSKAGELLIFSTSKKQGSVKKDVGKPYIKVQITDTYFESAYGGRGRPKQGFDTKALVEVIDGRKTHNIESLKFTKDSIGVAAVRDCSVEEVNLSGPAVKSKSGGQFKR